MIKIECTGCKYWGPLNDYDGSGGKCCNYAWITGKCRTTLPPREDGLCPGYEPGERVRADPKRHDKGLSPSRYRGGSRPKYDPEQMLALWQQGLTDGEIGEEIGAQKSAVKSWRHRRGLPPNVPRSGHRKADVRETAG